MSMTELKTLERIRKKIPATRGTRLVAGIGDDCAILRTPRSREDLLLTTDLLVEDIHFERATHTASAIGHKALARGLSDIAAMGGKPRFCLVSLGLPKWAGTRWIDGFYRGLLRLSEQAGAVLAGGDLARSEKLVCDIVVAGTVPRGTALCRDGARPGDAIYVSGVLGGSALGLSSRRGAAWRRHLWPAPRLALGEYLRRSGRVTAAMDLSDGLSIDLHRLALASGVSAVIDRPIPVFHGATLEQALHGGEDYELLFTAPVSARIPSRHRSIPLTRIGTVRQGRAGKLELFGWPVAPLGWDHLRGVGDAPRPDVT